MAAAAMLLPMRIGAQPEQSNQVNQQTMELKLARTILQDERMEMALEYPLTHRFPDKHGLVWGATTADWGDVQPEHKWGVELDENSHRAIDIYDNALLLVAIEEFGKTVCEGDATRTEHWSGRHRALRKATRELLWDHASRKFIPHIYLEGSPFPADFDESQVFYHGGTAVAIEAGLLGQKEIEASLRKMRQNVAGAKAATIGLTLHPPYPAGSFKNGAMRPYSYQNGGDWTWFGARMARQLAANGLHNDSYRELGPMLDRVLKHDGNYGTPAGVVEMLVQSHDGEIHLLPALPDEWKNGSAKGIVARGGFVVDLWWKDGQFVNAMIHSRHGGTLRVRYGDRTEVLETVPTEHVPISLLPPSPVN